MNTTRFTVICDVYSPNLSFFLFSSAVREGNEGGGEEKERGGERMEKERKEVGGRVEIRREENVLIPIWTNSIKLINHQTQKSNSTL